MITNWRNKNEGDNTFVSMLPSSKVFHVKIDQSNTPLVVNNLSKHQLDNETFDYRVQNLTTFDTLETTIDPHWSGSFGIYHYKIAVIMIKFGFNNHFVVDVDNVFVQ
jgi:hypothetical protein